MTTLDKLKPGQSATVHAVGGAGSAVYQRLLEMGVFEGAELKVVRFAPLGDPMEIHIQGYNLSLRKAEANLVQVELLAAAGEGSHL
jgi:Fe2+ transport system protein FeoA